MPSINLIKNQTIIGFALLIGLASCPAHAEMSIPKDSTILPKPDEKMNELNFFEGRWQCRSKSVEGPSRVTNSTWSARRALNNFWFLADTTDAKGIFIQHDTIGYNTLNQKFGRTLLDNQGRFSNFLSEGWQGNQLIWQGSSVNMATRDKSNQRIIVSKKGSQSFESVNYKSAADQQTWFPTESQICSKP